MEPKLAWYFAGPLLGLIIPLGLLLKEKQFGISSSLRVIGSFLLPTNEYFKYERSNDYWQVSFVIGLILAGLISTQFESLATSEYLEVYNTSNWYLFLIGGLFIGFGARYAGGCTAGHCIMGLSQLSLSSFVTTICFFIGGLIASYLLIPIFI